MQCQADYLGYIHGHVVEVGPTMPHCQFHMSNQNGGFICFVRGLIFEGHVLTYNPNTNEAEWVPVCSTTSDLSCVELSALTLCNLVPCIPEEGVKRLDQFGEHRDVDGGIRLLQQRSSARREWRMSPCVGTKGRMMGKTWMMRTLMRRVRAAQVPCKKALALPAVTPTGTAALIARLSRASLETGRMVPLEDSPQVRAVKAVKVRGRVKRGIHQPQNPPHCVNKSPPANQQRWPQRRQCPPLVTSCLQAARTWSLST